MKLSVGFINKLSFGLAILSIFIVIFACISPVIFVKKSNLFDFTETGQIVETIGGIMTPIVALAGVIVTFIAFLMQVSANRIQSEQILKSFNVKSVERKIECRNALELLYVDVQIMINHIDGFCAEINKFCAENTNRPTADTPLYHFSNSAINRYKTIDRNLLFDSFKQYVSHSDVAKYFSSVYGLLDYYSEGIENVYTVVYRQFLKDIMIIKKRLPEDYRVLSSAINKLDGELGLFKEVELYKQEEIRIINKNGVLDVCGFIFLLDKSILAPLYLHVEAEYNKAKKDLADLVSLNRMLVIELEKASGDFKKENHYGKLNFIKETIEYALNTHTVERIQSEMSEI